MSLRSKLDNIWYHYKGYIIASIFLIGTVIFGLHSCITKSEYDIKVYYFAGSSSMYQEQLDWVQAAVGEYCGDTNEDGKVQVAVTGIRVGSYSSASLRAEYMTAVQAGEVFLFFGDQEGIQYLYDNNYLQPMTAFTDQTEGNGYAWKVNGSGFSHLTKGFELFSDVDLYIAMRISDDTWAMSTSSGQTNYQTACDTLDRILAAKAEYDLRAYYLSASCAPDRDTENWVVSAFKTRCTDRNGDGKKIVDVTALDLLEPSTLNKYITAIKTSPDSFLIVGDEQAIALLAENGLLQSLPGGAQPTDPTGFGMKLNGHPWLEKVGSAAAFGERNYYLALRKCPDDASDEAKHYHTYAADLLNTLLEDDSK